MSSEPSSTLTELASAFGIATDFWDWQGQHTIVSAQSIRQVLAALGVDASTDEAAAHALADRRLLPWRRVLPPTVVMREGWTPWVPVHLPHGSDVRLDIALETGETRAVDQVDHWVEPREIDGMPSSVRRPSSFPATCDRLAPAARDSGAVRRRGDPHRHTRASEPSRRSLDQRAGRPDLMAQLYQVRSSRSWGVGDLGDLATLATWGPSDSVRTSSSSTRCMRPSRSRRWSRRPTLPTTRRFANPLYLQVEDIPETARLDDDAAARVQALAAAARPLNDSALIDRDGCWTAKREALELVHAVGLTGRRLLTMSAMSPRRGRAWRTSPRGARSSTCTGCRRRTGRRELASPAAPASTTSGSSRPTGSTSTVGCSGSVGPSTR
jgi:4-alpha-glucanotransferase